MKAETPAFALAAVRIASRSLRSERSADAPRVLFTMMIAAPALTGDDPAGERSAAGTVTQRVIGEMEKHYVVYVWATEPGESGRRAFGMTQEGLVVSAPAEEGELAPQWNSAFGGRSRPARRIFRQTDRQPFRR